MILTEKSKRQTITADLFLFPHQEAILNRLVEVESTPKNETLVGFLTDAPGTGKSFPLLALMLLEKQKFGKTQNLIVIPHSLHEQWISYIQRFSKDLTFASLMYYGDITSLYFDARALFEYDILITTATYFPIISQTIRDIKSYFARVIIDEIDSISFFTDTKIPTLALWLVSATAELTKEGKYHKIVKTDYNTITCQKEFIQKSIRLPPLVEKHHDCFNIQSFILNKLPHLTLDKEINALEFSKLDLKFYKHSISSYIETFKCIYIDNCLEISSIISSVASISRKMGHPDLQKKLLNGVAQETRTIAGEVFTFDAIKGTDWKNKRYQELSENVKKIALECCNKLCPLCGESFKEDSVRSQKTCCNKTIYHKQCILDWEKVYNKCPECWKQLTFSEGNSPLPPVDLTSTNISKDKIQTLEEIIHQESSKKPNWSMIVFSDYVGSFNQIKIMFDEKKFSYTEIEGDQLVIAKALDDFKKGEKNILLVHSKHYGGGLNLEFADSMVLFHKTCRNAQLIGRSQRYGRKIPLTVHYLTYKWEK